MVIFVISTCGIRLTETERTCLNLSISFYEAISSERYGRGVSQWVGWIVPTIAVRTAGKVVVFVQSKPSWGSDNVSNFE